MVQTPHYIQNLESRIPNLSLTNFFLYPPANKVWGGGYILSLCSSVQTITIWRCAYCQDFMFGQNLWKWWVLNIGTFHYYLERVQTKYVIQLCYFNPFYENFSFQSNPCFAVCLSKSFWRSCSDFLVPSFAFYPLTDGY